MVVLSAARDNTAGPPGLRLRDAEACVRFFSALARLTAEAASAISVSLDQAGIRVRLD